MKARGVALLLSTIVFASAPTAQLPPVSWTCPMHPEVLEDKKARCGICGMDLEPVRLVNMYTCPIHAVIEQSKPGKCRICSRDLVQMTAALTFACAANREISQLEPGKCPDGSAMVPRYTQRAHGDHNPKHGGIFFMAPDNWHHLEGTYPAPGRFRVYVYDDYSKPLSLANARKVRGRVVTKEVFDPKSGTRELASAPLVLARNGAFFEARIGPINLPAKLTAKISFRSDDKESRFDFTFPAYSNDPAPRPTNPMTQSPQVLAPPMASGSSRTTTSSESDALLNDLNARRAEVETLLKSGNYGAIYVPALQAKDTALDIQTRHASAAGIDRDALEANVKQIVLSAYLLDNYGDIGDGPKVQEAFAAFNAAIAALDSLVSGRR
jgi:Heavy metal binding domain